MVAIAALMLMIAFVWSCAKEPIDYSGSHNGHNYVDLGLPSGTLWATCNVGANSPEEYGDYFAWGETTPKDNYDWLNYKYVNINDYWCGITKYCTDPYHGCQGYIDTLTTLLPEDDAATSNWGVDWHIPTMEEWQELVDNTKVVETTRNGVKGRKFVANNGNSLFLPAAGLLYNGIEFNGVTGDVCSYWSNSLCTYHSVFAYYTFFKSDYCNLMDTCRSYGFSVRPVLGK